MQTTRLYAIYDKIAEEFGELMNAKHDAVALRGYDIAMQRAGSGRRAEYALYCLGEMDMETGMIKPQSPTIVVPRLSGAEERRWSMSDNPYGKVRTLKPGRSVFNLSYSKLLTCDLGQLIPIMCDEVVPGDSFKIGAEIVVRMMPMVAPILHEINLYCHYYFVPYRLLDENWEGIITGGPEGDDETEVPWWTPDGTTPYTDDAGNTIVDNGVGSLWDYLGMPTGVLATGVNPIAYPLYAYNLIYNQCYRDETSQAEISLNSPIIKNRCWEKDYFTSALPWQQRGTAPGLPVTISGTGNAVWPGSAFAVGAPTQYLGGVTPADSKFYATDSTVLSSIAAALNSNTVDMADATATSFDVADLRLAFQIQKWMERNARGGARYIEFLQNHFGESPRDERIQRPEYIGGCRMPVMVSEVLQTGATGTTPQGNMAGHGLVAGAQECASYHATEYGLIMGIMSIMPRTMYSQGVNRQWLRQTRYDFYSPEWAHLSEQAVLRGELYADSSSPFNRTVFGYQGRYNEMRAKQNMVCSRMRYGVSGSLSYWHLGRHFAGTPAINDAFLKCVPSKAYLAAPSQPACIVHVGNKIKAVRPMPVDADPGLIDH